MRNVDFGFPSVAQKRRVLKPLIILMNCVRQVEGICDRLFKISSTDMIDASEEMTRRLCSGALSKKPLLETHFIDL